MGYYITIVDNNLRSRKDISQELKKAFEKDEFYIDWEWDDGHVRFDENYFKWDSRFIKDLLILKDLKVSRFCTGYGEEGEYYKYAINSNGVKKFYGRVVYPKKPEGVYESKKDIKEPY